MTLRRVSIRMDGVEVGAAVIDLDIDLPEEYELVFDGSPLISASGEVTLSGTISREPGEL